jgi:hypothetical protein
MCPRFLTCFTQVCLQGRFREDSGNLQGTCSEGSRMEWCFQTT